MATEKRDLPGLTAVRMVERFGFDIELADSVVLVYDTGLVPAKATSRKQRRSQHPFRQVGSLSDTVDIIVAAGPGAPVAAITVEFLAAFGVTRLVAVGSAGHLGRDDTPPTHPMCVISRAESDEGTSRHYGGDLTADATLTAALTNHVVGPPQIALTTDVPFRHTTERLASHRQRADVVEMECAALFAAANHFGIAAAALLVLSDTFEGDGWRHLGKQATAGLAGQARDSAHDILARDHLGESQ